MNNKITAIKLLVFIKLFFLTINIEIYPVDNYATQKSLVAYINYAP